MQPSYLAAKTPTQQSFWQRLRPWVICLSGALLFFYEFIQINVMNSLNIYLAHSFGYSPAQISWLASITFIADAALVLVAGLLLDRISTKRLILVAMTLCTFGVVLMASSHSFFSFAIGRFVIGLGGAFCFLSGFTLATRWFDPNKLSFITGVIITIGMSGGLVAQHPAMWLFSTVGWRNGLWIDAAIGFVMLIWMSIIIKDAPNHAMLIKTRAMLKNHGIIASLLTVMRNTQVWYAAFFASILNLAIFLIGALWGTRYLMVSYHMSAAAASGISSMVFLGSIIGAPLCGYLADRFSQHKLLMVSFAIATVLFAAIIVYGNLSAFKLALLFFGLGLSTSAQTLSYSHASRQAGPGFKATSSSLVSTVLVGLAAIVQPIFGWLLQLHGNTSKLQPSDFHLAFSMLLGLFVIATICALRIKIARRVGGSVIDAPFAHDDAGKQNLSAQTA